MLFQKRLEALLQAKELAEAVLRKRVKQGEYS
jgi:hypothetical protein